MDRDKWMREAIGQAQAGIAAGQSPFGAVIVRENRVIGAGHNEVWLRGDPTAHAEIVAIQRAARELNTIDLTGGVIFTTCEPCPMCAAAIHWARLGCVFFGAEIADAAAAGFNELHVSAIDLYDRGGSGVEIAPGILRTECVALFSAWRKARLGEAY